MKYFKILLAAMVMPLQTMAQSAPDPDFHIYLCFGQSNMEGAGVIEGQDTLYVDPRFKAMAAVDDQRRGRKRGEWHTAYPPQTRQNTNLSVVDYFGRTMVESLPENIRVGTITVAVGGASISLFDPDSCAAYLADKGTADWLRNMAHAYDDKPYARLVELARKAQREGVIKGILLHQGETNNGDATWPRRVNAIYTRLLGDLGLQAKDVPLLVGETARTEEGGICGLHNSVIDTISHAIPTAHVISSEGCKQRGDGLHFTPEAYRTLGRRYATTMLSLLGVDNSKDKGKDNGWTTTWATAIEPEGKDNMPKGGTLTNKTIRQIVRVSRSGDKIRLRLSNAFGKSPLEITSVFIADAAIGSDIDAKTMRQLTFGGKRTATIAAGRNIVSDALKYNLKPLQRLAITVSYGATPNETTGHRGSRTTSFLIDGKATKKTSFADAEKVEHWYTIAAVEVAATEPQGDAIAVIGNSITDGRGSTTDGNDRWTDFMATALQQSGSNQGVLNLGIGGNSVIRGGLGPTALSRFTPDVIKQQGVGSVIIFEGINDIGGTRDGNCEHKAAELIEAYKSLIGQARAHGLKVYGATIMPFGKSFYDKGFFREAVRQTVNEWIRNGGAFDGVIDFDQVTRDPAAPHALKAEYQSDWLHPNPKGYEAMGKYAAQFVINNQKSR